MCPRDVWKEMWARSFSPEEWYLKDDVPCNALGSAAGTEGSQPSERGARVWVYRQVAEGRWAVGYYEPSGGWFTDSVHLSRDSASARMHWCNGGGHGAVKPNAKINLRGAGRH